MQTCHFVYPKTGGSLSPPSHCLVLGVKVLPRPPAGVLGCLKPPRSSMQVEHLL